MRLASAIGAAAITWLVLAAPARADTFTVDTTKDGVDANLADAVCAAASGKCTLRAAVDEANDEAGNDEIDLPKGTFKLTLPKAFPQANNEGEIDVTEAVEIDGRGPTKTVIEQTVKDRVLRNDAPFASFSMPGLQLSGVTLTGGRDRRRRRERRRRPAEQRVHARVQHRHPRQRRHLRRRRRHLRRGHLDERGVGPGEEHRPRQRGGGQGRRGRPRGRRDLRRGWRPHDPGRLEGGLQLRRVAQSGGARHGPGRRHPGAQSRDGALRRGLDLRQHDRGELRAGYPAGERRWHLGRAGHQPRDLAQHRVGQPLEAGRRPLRGGRGLGHGERLDVQRQLQAAAARRSSTRPRQARSR